MLSTVKLPKIRYEIVIRMRGGIGFLFGTPWAWLLDRGWVPDYHHHSMQLLFGYAIILWIPALLYSGCLWLLLRGLAKLTNVGPPPRKGT